MAITVDHAAVGGTLTQAEYEAGSGAAHSVSGEVAQANQAAIEAETNENTYMSPDLATHMPGAMKARARITAAGAADGLYNVSGIDDDGTGDFGINYSVTLSAEANAAQMFIAGQLATTVNATGDYVEVDASGTTAIEIGTFDSGNALADRGGIFTLHGDL